MEEHNLANNQVEKIESFEKKIREITNNSSIRKNKINLSEEEMDSAKDELKKLGYI